tara:strand:- start:458 stop:973 length:516 start_codon:yes stop_codon:yes gene_type:complete
MSDNDQLISRLKFLSKINKNEKIDTKNLVVQAADTYYTSLTRTYKQDSRNNTLSFIQSIIRNSFLLIDKYAKSDVISEQTIVKHLTDDIQNCKLGITNVKSTYESDTMFCCNLDTLLQNIDAKVSELKIKFPNLFNIKLDYLDNTTNTDNTVNNNNIFDKPKEGIRKRRHD